MYEQEFQTAVLSRLETANQAIGRLQQQIDAAIIAPAMDISAFTQFIEAIEADHFIDAIKLVRTAFSISLKEAKELCDRVRDRRPAPYSGADAPKGVSSWAKVC